MDKYASSQVTPAYTTDDYRYALELTSARVDIEVPETVHIGDEWSFEFYVQLTYDTAANYPESEYLLTQPDCENGIHVESNEEYFNWFPIWPYPLIQLTSIYRIYPNRWTHYSFINDYALGEIRIIQYLYNYGEHYTATLTQKGANLCRNTPLVFAENSGFTTDMRISEFRFWNRVLQAERIYYNYNK